MPLDSGRTSRENQNSVAEKNCLVNIVGHKENRALRRIPDAEQLLLHEVAALGVDVDEGFVAEKHLGIGGQGSRDSRQLLHAAR